MKNIINFYTTFICSITFWICKKLSLKKNNYIKPIRTPNKCCELKDGLIGTSNCWCSL